MSAAHLLAPCADGGSALHSAAMVWPWRRGNLTWLLHLSACLTSAMGPTCCLQAVLLPACVPCAWLSAPMQQI